MKNAIEELKNVIDETLKDMSNVTDKPQVHFTRNRKLNAEKTISTILNMQGNSLNAELFQLFPDADARMTPSAFIQAREKLHEETFDRIFHAFNDTMTNVKTENGYRILAADGSDFNTPFNPSSAYLCPNGKNKSFCQVHGNLLMDLRNRVFVDCILQPRMEMDERRAIIEMAKRLNPNEKNLIIMDRGYTAFNLFESLNRMKNVYYLVRTKCGNGAIKEIAELPDEECDIDIEFKVTTKYKTVNSGEGWHKFNAEPKKRGTKKHSKYTRYKEWDFEDDCIIKVRVCKFRINDADSGKEEWEVLVTNLSREDFPLEKMKELYHERWGIETAFRDLKYSVGAVQFHCKKDKYIRQEVLAHLVVFNVVSRMRNALEVKKVNTKHSYKLNFKMCVSVIRKYMKEWKFTEEIFNIMEKYLLPIRAGKKDTRNLIKFKSAIWFNYRVA